MPKLEHWTDSIPLIALMLAAFFAGCLTATKFNELEWETLAAGLFAILAGIFALHAARLQAHNQRELQTEQNNREEEINRIAFLQEMEIFTHVLMFNCESILKYLSDVKTNQEPQPPRHNKLDRTFVQEYLSETLPIKPFTTDADTSYIYNQIRLKLHLIKKNIELSDGWKTDTDLDKALIETTIGLAKGLLHSCRAFPKSNLVFAQKNVD